VRGGCTRDLDGGECGVGGGLAERTHHARAWRRRARYGTPTGGPAAGRK
jgi:hypothetical protein